MKAMVDISALTSALARLKGIAGRKAALPVLAGVLIEAVEGALRLTATDLDQYLIVDIPAEVEKPGAIVVPCVRLQAALVKIEAERIVLQTTGRGRLVGAAGTMHFELCGLAPEEMPKVPQITGAVEAEFPPGELAAVIDRELLAASEDETRYVLNGIHLLAKDDAMQFVATDGRRLAVTELKGRNPKEGDGLSVIVPTEACTQLACLDDGGATRLRFSATQIEASGQGWRLVSKLIEGNYPNWQQVVPPAGGGHRFEVDRLAFMEALAFAATLSIASTQVRVEWRENGLFISASLPDVGLADAKVAANIVGGKMATAFSATYLLEALGAMTTDDAIGEMSDAASPLRLSDGMTVHVIMPMRLAEGEDLK